MRPVEMEIVSAEVDVPGTVMVLLSAKMAEHDFAVIEQVALRMPVPTYQAMPEGRFVLRYETDVKPATRSVSNLLADDVEQPAVSLPEPRQKKARKKPEARAVLQKANPEPTIVVATQIPRVDAPEIGAPNFQAHSAATGPLPVATNIPAPMR